MLLFLTPADESKALILLNGDMMCEATPVIRPTEMGPYLLESIDLDALSPSTQQ